MNDYFVRQPYYSLWRTDRAYRKMSTFAGRTIDQGRVRKVAENLRTILGQDVDDERIDALSKRYFEVLTCDDLDAWLWLLKPWSQRKRHVVVKGEENFREVVNQKRGCLLVSSHFGGGFFIFEIVKELGGKPQGFGREIKRDYFRDDYFRWLYLKFRMFCVERAIGEKIIYIGRKETGKEFLDKLEQGYHIVVFFDVPPGLIREKPEKVNLLGRDWNFAKGFLKVVAGKEIPVVPFFGCLTENHTREFRFFPPLQVRTRDGIKDALQECARHFEHQFLQRPEQWFFLEEAEVFW